MGKKSRLDRVLLNVSWWDLGKWSITVENQKKSDHRPLILKIDHQDWGPVPFKVYNPWLKNEQLLANIKVIFGRDQVMGCKDIQSSLRDMRNFIKQWSKEPGNNVDSKIKVTENQIALLDNFLYSHTHKQQLCSLRVELEELYESKVALLQQQARTA